MPFNPLNYSICFDKPRRLTDVSSWHEHIPFAFTIMQMLKPKIFVELGTHKGDSYCAFCQAVDVLGLDTACYAIDTWEGDEHSGSYGLDVLEELKAYHNPLYGRFSKLMKSRFDQALNYFSDGSIDLLHIDGLHSYEAVKHDFETWLPKMSERSVILLHDINVREREFGVWNLWEELKEKYPYFEFKHGHGLGVLVAGGKVPTQVMNLADLEEQEVITISKFFSYLGDKIKLAESLSKIQSVSTELNSALQARDARITELNSALQARDARIIELTSDMQAGDAQVTELTSAVQARDARITELNGALKSMQESIVWRLLMWYHNRFVERALPHGTRRKRLYDKALKGGRIIVNEGWISLIAFLMHIGNSIRKSDPKLMREWKKKINTMKKKTKIILFVDRHVPTFDRDAGSFIIYEYLNVLAKLGYNIIFWPHDLRNIEPYSSDIKNNNIEIVTGNLSYYEFLREFGKKIDYIFLSRPEIAHEYIGISKKFSSAKKIYIGHDLHYLREKRGEEITSKNSSYKNTKKIEENIMLNADISLFFSDKEVDIINHEFKGINAKVMPWIQELHMKEAELNSERKEILFLGGFKHLPNLDAMLWFKEEIFPLVKKAIPSAHMTIIGSDPTEELLKMENDDCTITGYVEESKLSDIFKKARVFVAPLRYGAGFKGKIAKAMSFGVPVVTTTIGSEGIGLEDGKAAMITDNPSEFAEKIIQLYKEDSIWQNMSTNAADHLRNNFSFENAKHKIKEFLN